MSVQQAGYDELVDAVAIEQPGLASYLRAMGPLPPYNMDGLPFHMDDAGQDFLAVIVFSHVHASLARSDYIADNFLQTIPPETVVDCECYHLIASENEVIWIQMGENHEILSEERYEGLETSVTGWMPVGHFIGGADVLSGDALARDGGVERNQRYFWQEQSPEGLLAGFQSIVEQNPLCTFPTLVYDEEREDDTTDVFVMCGRFDGNKFGAVWINPVSEEIPDARRQDSIRLLKSVLHYGHQRWTGEGVHNYPPEP